MACNYTEEQFDTQNIRKDIPLEQFDACGEEIQTSDIYYAAREHNQPDYREPLVNIPPGNVVPVLLAVVAGLAGLTYFVVKNTNWKVLRGEKPMS